jgi:hypothetical protein
MSNRRYDAIVDGARRWRHEIWLGESEEAKQ